MLTGGALHAGGSRLWESRGVHPPEPGGRARLFALAAFLAVLGIVSPVAAFPTARLVYVRGIGAESCPEEMELRLAVVHRLGYDPFDSGARRTLIAVVEGTPARLTSRLELVDERGLARGERRMEAPPGHCVELVHALALAISIAIDPGEEESAAEPETSFRPSSRPEVAPPVSDERSVAAASIDADGERLTLRFGLGGGAAFGSAPSPVPGLLLIGSLRQAAWSLALEGRLDAAGSLEVPAGVTVESKLLLASLAPCYHYDAGYGCALASLGRITASSDAAAARTAETLYAGFGVRFGAEWSFGSLVVRGNADLLATPTRARILLDQRQVWRMPWLSGAFGLALLGRI